MINPEDIQDLTVLKDATAAIYGARAADGAILGYNQAREKLPHEQQINILCLHDQTDVQPTKHARKHDQQNMINERQKQPQTK